MKSFLTFAFSVLICVLTLLMAEGAYSIYRWKISDRSIVFQAYNMLRNSTSEIAQPELNLAGREQIEALIPEIIQAGAGLGNVPYTEVMNQEAAINTRAADGCTFPKPSLKKRMTYLRTTDFELFDWPVIFYDSDAALEAQLREFIDKYAIRLVSYQTNGLGERLTFPKIEARDIVLIAGDSVANGIMVADEETLASALQQRDATRQYINIGVGGASADDILCNLASAALRYHGRIKEVVYVFCENDFKPNKKRRFTDPEDIIAKLSEYAEKTGVTKVTIVYAPYIYTTVPHITRFKGYRGENRPTYHEKVERLLNLASTAGFKYVSISEIAQNEIKEKRTDFAALSLYVDSVHLSPYGTEKLANRLLDIRP